MSETNTQTGGSDMSTTEQLRSQVGRKVRLVTVPMLAAATGDSVRSIWRKVQDGTLPRPFKWGAKAVWRESDLERIIGEAAGEKAKG